MSDIRQALKQDVDDLRKHIDDKFDAQSEARAKVYDRLENMSMKDVEHGMKIQFLESRLNKFFAALTTISIGVFISLCKIILDYFKG